MDDATFDALTRQLNIHLTRRRGLRRVAGLGLLLGALPAAGIAPDVVAKKRKHKKKKKKKPKGTRCQEGQTVCGSSCCTPPPGLTVAQMTCRAIGANAVCLCEFRASEVCAAGCSSSELTKRDCTAVDRADLDDFCQEIGCKPPT